MTRHSKAMFGFLMVFCVASASATSDRGFFADNLSSSKVSKVKTANYYGYSNTELSCLSQINFKSCRYTGCPQCTFDTSNPGGGTNLDNEDFGFTNLFFQTDFTCCPKDQSYSYDKQHDVGQLGFSDKVGTCDWEISVYRWPRELGNLDINTPELAPVLTDDGTALKFGTAWGTCYLNAEAEHCDHPLCERMAINVQGGLYGSLAYGDTDALSIAPFEETCAGGPPAWCNLLGANACNPNTDKRRVAPGSANVEQQQAPTSIFGEVFNFFAQITEELLGQTITGEAPDLGDLSRGSRSMVRACPEVNGKRAHVCSRRAANKKAPAKIQAADGDAKTLYPGIALILSGPFHVTSKHDDKYEETGLFEFAPLFLGLGDAVAEPVNKWPVVRGKGAKIRFTKEQHSYGEQSYGYDNKYEQKYDDKYGGDKEYYERKEYHRER